MSPTDTSVPKKTCSCLSSVCTSAVALSQMMTSLVEPPVPIGIVAGPGTAEIDVATLRRDDFLLGDESSKTRPAQLLIVSAMLSARALPKPKRAQLVRRQQQQLEPGRVARLQRENDLLRDFVRRDHLPRIDVAVFVLVDSPARAGRVEPAVLVGLAVEVRIDVAIDLERRPRSSTIDRRRCRRSYRQTAAGFRPAGCERPTK